MKPVVLNIYQSNEGQCDKDNDYWKDFFHIEQFTANPGVCYFGGQISAKIKIWIVGSGKSAG
jgi:hypothetical protein